MLLELAHKVALFDKDFIIRKEWLPERQIRGKYPAKAIPTSVYSDPKNLPSWVTNEDAEEKDWIIVGDPSKPHHKERIRICNNLRRVLGKDSNLGERAKQLIKEIADWSLATFPDATILGQCKKLAEEEQEYSSKPATLNMSELADVLVVCIGLDARGSMAGKAVVHDFLTQCYAHSPFVTRDSSLLVDALSKKFEVLKERTRKGMWKKTDDGEYHH